MNGRLMPKAVALLYKELSTSSEDVEVLAELPHGLYVWSPMKVFLSPVTSWVDLKIGYADMEHVQAAWIARLRIYNPDNPEGLGREETEKIFMRIMIWRNLCGPTLHFKILETDPREQELIDNVISILKRLEVPA